MSVLTETLESFASLLVTVQPDSPDDLAKIGTSLRDIMAKAALIPELQGHARKAIGVLECADIPLDVESLTELHRAAEAMLAADRATAEEAEPAAAGPGRVDRDPDTVALFAEFFEESEDALTEADRILMEAGELGVNAEGIHALFRVFHTLKGVAGFLDLTDVAKLAHTTETLLGAAREGTLELGPSAHDCLLETTQLMRRLVGAVSQAVGSSTAVPSNAEPVQRLVTWLEAETRGESKVAETAAAAVVSKSEGGDEEARQRATIKVDVERVDGVLEMIGELVLLESMLTHASEMDDVRVQLTQLAKITRNLQSQAMRMRMVPVRAQFQRLPRIVRDTAKKANKQVKLEMIGASTEVDRGMVDRLGDPLIHMLRNAVDHGIEPPEVRRQLGKPETATITVAAFHEGSSVVIELSDDGRGLDRDAILAKARSKGIVREGQVLTDDEIHQLIFEPGFSTAAKVTELSGRGVGMDVVKKTIVGMRGRVVIRTTPGQGTTFRLVLPLTLAIIDATVVRVGTERFVIPSLSMVESVQPTRWMCTTMGGHRELVRFRGNVLPLFRASELFGVPGDTRTEDDLGMLVVVDAGGQELGVMVDEVIGQQQVVVKNLDGTLAQSSSFIGAAILSDGKVAFILDVDDLGHLGERVRLASLPLTEETAA